MREYELAIIGILLSEPELFHDVKDLLNSDDFNDADARGIYEYICKTGEVDFVDIASRFDSTFVAELTLSVPDSKYLYKYIAKVKQQGTSKRLVENLSNLIADLRKNPHGLNDILNRMEEELRKTTQHDETEFAVAIKQNIHNIVEYLEKLKKKEIIGLQTGIKAIDEMFLGIQPGLYVVAGRPHMGKTTFSLRLASQLALHGARVLFAPLEDGADQMTKMLIAMQMGISFRELLNGYYNVSDFYDKSRVVAELPISFTNKRFDANTLRRYVSQHRAEIDVLFIDQINHVNWEKSADPRWSLNQTIRKIKQIAVDFRLPVFLLSQLNREVEKREDKRPRLSDLKETGSLEEDADVVILLYRDGYYNKNSSSNILELIIPKNKKTYDTGTLILADEGKKIKCGKPANVSN